jgi:hypothetical protein
MWGSVKGLVVCGALITTGLGAAAPAAAATAPVPPTLLTQNFACSNGVCEVGPGNVGIAFSAVLLGTGGPPYSGPECSPYIISVVSGSLPPGLNLGAPDCTYLITGTPTKAGRYAFAVQITPQPNNLGQPAGPPGTQRLTITIGTGSSDRLVLDGQARLNLECGNYGPILQLVESDANTGVTYTVTATSTDKPIGTFTDSSASPGGVGHSLSVSPGTFPSIRDPGSVTVTDSLGGSATIPVSVRSGC